MYAIVKISGEQIKVTLEKRFFTAKLPQKVGEKITLDEKDILLISDEKKTSFGTPFVKGSTVTAEVIKHIKGPKTIVFKKKRRKGYAVKNGHRQAHTQILIKSITTK